LTALITKGFLRRPIVWAALVAGILFAVWVNQPFPFTQTQRTISYYSVGSALAESGRAKEAIPLFQEALRSTPDFPAAYKEIGAAWMTLGRNDAAIQSLKQAIRFTPDDVDALSRLGGLLFAEQDFEGAAEIYATALRLDPERATLLTNLGAALINLKRH
jgi:tetratricopeptide (TPR) repeat protein